jgi:hypothetical protein
VALASCVVVQWAREAGQLAVILLVVGSGCVRVEAREEGWLSATVAGEPCISLEQGTLFLAMAGYPPLQCAFRLAGGEINCCSVELRESIMRRRLEAVGSLISKHRLCCYA